jgi:hypothetical protein
MADQKKKSPEPKAADKLKLKIAIIGFLGVIAAALIASIGNITNSIIASYANKSPIVIVVPVPPTTDVRLTETAAHQAVPQSSLTPANPVISSPTRGVDSLPPPVLPAATAPWSLLDGIPYSDGCVIHASPAPQAGRENAIQIKFEISPKGFCSWVVPLNGYDASARTSLTFWVKGQVGGEQFKVGMKDAGLTAGLEPKEKQTASAAWEKVSIPLSKFKDTRQNLAALENFSLGFEESLGSGTIYVADFGIE